LIEENLFKVTREKAEEDKSIIMQAGVGVSTKNFKKAVDRNRIKRLMRESYRLQKISLSNKLKEKNLQLALFFIYTAKDLPEFKIISEKIGLILQRIAGEIE
jgi:ribonuclease P protein component